jgi:Acyclic terpene utilisation family protein AtuA
MKDVVRLGAGSGFWGDALDPAVELIEKGELDYMAFDFLAELTMALLQRQKLKDPHAGYIPDVVTYMQALMPAARQRGTKLVSNGGGANPRAAGKQIVEVARKLGLKGIKIGVVEGDDLLPRLDDFIAQGMPLAHLETGENNVPAMRNRVVSANAYIDSSGITEALAEGADVVVTGRVSDNGPYVGPIMHEFGWKHDEQHADRIASAITIGHLAECAAGVTGGMSSRWAEMPNMGRVGFPIIDFSRNGTAVISKLPGSGGRVDQWTVKEHLLYEIGDPRNYLMPDGVPDFTTIQLRELGPDRVELSGIRGRTPPDTLKLIIGYTDGWIGEGMMFFPWPDALGRAQKAKDTLLERFDRLELDAQAIHFDFVGINMLHGPAAPAPDYEPNEVGLRVAVKTETREEAEKIRRACSNLWIMGPGGTSFGTPMKPRPVIACWPTLVPRSVVRQHVEIMEV